MTPQEPSVLSLSSASFDEERWIMNISTALEEDEEDQVKIPVSVFCVAKPLLSAKPEAFTPQLFALGPYHHWQPSLYEMERYKIATTKRTAKQLLGLKLHQLVDQIKEHDYTIRAHYHRYLDYSSETLAWMMVIDGSFLLEFLRNYSDADRKVFNKIPSMSHMVDSSRMKLAYNQIVRDIMMLENQIPLSLIRKILRSQTSSPDEELSDMLMGFAKDVSPFKVAGNLSSMDVKKYSHLLQFIYCMIVPKSKVTCDGAMEIDMPEAKEEEPAVNADSTYVKQLLTRVKSMDIGPIRFVRKVLIAKPIKLLVKVPWSVLSRLPIVSIMKGPIESIFTGGGEGDDDDSKEGGSSKNASKPPLVEEIMIPSVTELSRAGVKFSPTTGDLTTIAFDKKTKTFYLPKVSLDSNTEILLRNLVAYETSVESGPMVFTRYTELMNGIIDTEDDVSMLREKGIIKNRLKKDEEVASLWNGMSRSVRLSKVGFIDQVLVDVNRYYSGRWSVKMRKFMSTYVLGSWKFLTFLAAILLLFMTCIQAFCSVYSCSAHWSKYLESGDGEGS